MGRCYLFLHQRILPEKRDKLVNDSYSWLVFANDRGEHFTGNGENLHFFLRFQPDSYKRPAIQQYDCPWSFVDGCRCFWDGMVDWRYCDTFIPLRAWRCVGFDLWPKYRCSECATFIWICNTHLCFRIDAKHYSGLSKQRHNECFGWKAANTSGR